MLAARSLACLSRAPVICLLKTAFKTYLEDVFGLQPLTAVHDEKLDGVMQLLIEILKGAKAKKDYATSDKIRNQLATIGIAIKDEKDGNVSWNSL